MRVLVRYRDDLLSREIRFRQGSAKEISGIDARATLDLWSHRTLVHARIYFIAKDYDQGDENDYKYSQTANEANGREDSLVQLYLRILRQTESY